jgi:hypothetical protein
LLAPGANFLFPPTVVIEPPQAVGGRRAEAAATMEEDFDERYNLTAAKRFRIAHVTVTDPGWGYTQRPKIFFVDDPREDPKRSQFYELKAKASAMAVLSIDKVIVNHDYSLYRYAARILVVWFFLMIVFQGRLPLTYDVFAALNSAKGLR